MKFDCIIINPPFSKLGKSGKKTHPIWDKIVINSITDLLEDDGIFAALHPSGWRNAYGKFKKVQDLLLSNNLMYLEMHDLKDGIDIFGVNTDYDFYILKKDNNYTKTVVKDFDGIVSTQILNKFDFIPSGKFDEIYNMVATEQEENVKIIHDCSYHTQTPIISDRSSDIFKYKCIYTVNKHGIPNCKYSNTNSKGHYGIPKLVWSNGSCRVGSFIDFTGEYLLNNFTSAIAEEVTNLPQIKEAFDSKKFRDLMYYCQTGYSQINYRIISTFKKDWWREFQE